MFLQFMPVWATCVACLFSLITALVCWGMREEYKRLKTELLLLKTELLLELSKEGQRLFDKVDKIYARKETFRSRVLSPTKARPRKLNGKH